MEKKPTRLDLIMYCLERQRNLINAHNGLLGREREELLDSVETIKAQIVELNDALVASLQQIGKVNQQIKQFRQQFGVEKNDN